jgi:hypothetical protein
MILFSSALTFIKFVHIGYIKSNKNAMRERKYPFVSTEFRAEANDRDKDLIRRYWELGGVMFLHKPTDLANEAGCTTVQLNGLVKKESVSTLFLGLCKECGKEIKIGVTAQQNVIDKLRNLQLLCGECHKSLLETLRPLPYAKQKLVLLHNAVRYELWKALDPKELEILRKIVESDDWRSIVLNVLKPDFDTNWSILEKLHLWSLVELRKNENGKVSECFSLQELTERLKEFKPLPIKGNPDTKLRFNIPQKERHLKATDPNYSKTLYFDKPIGLKADTRYICSIWIKEDDSLDFRLTPASELPGGEYKARESSSEVFPNWPFGVDNPTSSDY